MLYVNATISGVRSYLRQWEVLCFNVLLLAYFLQIILFRPFGVDIGRNILITDNGGGG
jgi:hypothetical protein